MTDRNDGEYGLPFDDETDGPDVVQARAAFEESVTVTDELEVAMAESRKLNTGLQEVGDRNHFIEKWKALLEARGKVA
jgi:hypothetical protein